MKGLWAGLAAFALAVVIPTAWLAVDGLRALDREEEAARANLLARAREREGRVAGGIEAAFARRLELETARPEADYRPETLALAGGRVVLAASPLAGAPPVEGAGPWFEIGPGGLAGPDPARLAEVPGPAVLRLARYRERVERLWLALEGQTAQRVFVPNEAAFPQVGSRQVQGEQTQEDVPDLPVPGAPSRIESRPEPLFEAQLRWAARPADLFGDAEALAEITHRLEAGKGKGGDVPAVEIVHYPFQFVQEGAVRVAVRLVRLAGREVRLQGFVLDLEGLVLNVAPGEAVAGPGVEGTSVELAGERWGVSVEPSGLDDLAEGARVRRARFVAMAAAQGLVVVAGLAVLGVLVRGRMELARRRAEFVAAVSHELRTPLAAIRMHAELLPDRLAGEPGRAAESIRFLRAESERMTRLVENVLSASGIERRAKEYRFEIADVGEVAREVADSWRDLVHDSGGELEVRIGSLLPPARFDREAMRRILVNLLDNAAKFSDGPPWIELAVSASPEGIAIEVADRGIGFPPGPTDRLFERFVRAEDERVRSRPGTGLGLHLVAEYTAAHGGRVSAGNREGGGAVVRIHLPAA